MINKMKNVKLFRGIDDETLKYYIDRNLISFNNYNINEIVALEGDQCLSVGFVLTGQLKVENYYLDGTSNLVRIINQNSIFADALFLNEINNEYPATITATTDSLIGFINFTDFKSMLFTNQTLQVNFFTNMSNRIIKLNNRVKVVSQPTTMKRLIHFLLEEKDENNIIELSISMSQLATYICASRMSIHRSIKKLEQLKIIKYSQKRVKILNLQKLLDFLNEE